MSSFEQASPWTATLPSAWPNAPAEMTVTALAEIEACPRRWALGAAPYPDLWSGRGYPPRVQLSALAGTVVHRALEAITRELVRAGCPTATPGCEFPGPESDVKGPRANHPGRIPGDRIPRHTNRLER